MGDCNVNNFKDNPYTMPQKKIDYNLLFCCDL